MCGLSPKPIPWGHHACSRPEPHRAHPCGPRASVPPSDRADVSLSPGRPDRSGAAQQSGRVRSCVADVTDSSLGRTVHRTRAAALHHPLSLPAAQQTPFQAFATAHRPSNQHARLSSAHTTPLVSATRDHWPLPGRTHRNTASHEGRARSSDAASGGGHRRPCHD